MKRSLAIRPIAQSLFLTVTGFLTCSPLVLAHETGQQHVHFQKPSLRKSQKTATNRRLTFQTANRANASQSVSTDRSERKSVAQRKRPLEAKSVKSRRPASLNPLRERPAQNQSQSAREYDIPVEKKKVTKQNRSTTSTRQVKVASYRVDAADLPASPDPFPVEYVARKLKQRQPIRRDELVAPVYQSDVVYESGLSDACANCGSQGACEPGCGLAETSCGIGEPGCGIMEPGCGIVDDCGSSVGPPVPDYWCFPVCLPRVKVFTAWAGVHSFRDSRDFVNTDRGTANYGFQEGINIGGRAPIIGRLFPQLGYQLGYQATQSRLSGTATDSSSRSQSFITIGLFRRVPVGLQFGVAWDFMQDQLADDASQSKADLQQLRAEISLKTPRGREIGLSAATSLNSRDLSFGGAPAVTYQTVDQYLLFYRWHFLNQGVGRCWVGGTNDNEAVLGADFQVPLNDRWSLQSGFNYLSPDQRDVTQEAWNLGMNLIWHWGRTARTGRSNPFSSLFPVADNGWMFVDRAP